MTSSMSPHPQLHAKRDSTELTAMPIPKITFTHTESSKNKCATATKARPEPKSPDSINTLMPRKSLASMSDEEIIQENLKELQEIQSREERKANGRLVAVIVAFLVIFMAVYHAWMRKPAELGGMLVPAGIMLTYGAWVVVLAKRDKHRRAMFEKHIEEVALKNKWQTEEKHSRMKHSHADKQGCSTPISLQYVNELIPSAERRKKKRHHRQRQHEVNNDDVKVHRGHKRPSFRQKLFGQTIAHVKLLEMQSESMDFKDTDSLKSSADECSKKQERLKTLSIPQDNPII